ncbi:hypothetical protein ACFL23_01495 [Patescibacteria group bacterium]
MKESKMEMSAEIGNEKLQNSAEQFKQGEMTEEEKSAFVKLADAYIAENGTGDHGYYGDCPSPSTSYDEYAFYDLPGGLCLEGRAMCRQNVFQFHDVLTAEEREKRIAYLESTSEDEE